MPNKKKKKQLNAQCVLTHLLFCDFSDSMEIEACEICETTKRPITRIG